ncbi:hypothetical protein G9463_18425 [Haloarcula sp. JP-Z28]|uniref:hypothetical protein n=1 Tax=Haloarcula sp. JP-Z28 TaxID=2716715 RepID=UPI001405455F|nr:hypothetical protein [Haloarcula sp. JP-Z28]NHN65261.1 hypothetical protein [Haloarcula sp. JP-Z28]
MTDDELPRMNESEIEFFESNEGALFYGNMVVDVGRRFKPVVESDSPTTDVMGSTKVVRDVDPDTMEVLLTYQDSQFGREVVHWPSEGGKYVPVDEAGFTENN